MKCYSGNNPSVVRALLILFVLMLATASSNAQFLVPEAEKFLHARPVIFTVNRTEIHTEDSLWIADTLVHKLEDLGDKGIVYGRAAASPEGPIPNNKRLANGRRDSAVKYLLSHGFDASQIQFETVTEDYGLLLSMMKAANDSDYIRVRTLVEMYPDDEAPLKRAMKKLRNGQVWERLLKEYYPQLRAVRIIATERMKEIRPDFSFIAPDPAVLKPLKEVKIERPRVRPVVPAEPEEEQPSYRREFLSVKTNLLGYALNIPQYGYCPIPNFQIEFYPKRGHWTGALSLDNPWWIGNTTNHKYMEVRNWQLEGRYYFRNSNKSIGKPEAAFKGLYVQAYGQTGLYQIGFSAKKGWIGEGGGGGIGVGYVLPFTHRQHWRVEFSAQFGIFSTRYDPFVYGDPVDHHLENDYYKDYYYNWTKDADLFKRRQYRFTWVGPTKVGVSISYDLLYRKPFKGISFRSRNKK